MAIPQKTSLTANIICKRSVLCKEIDFLHLPKNQRQFGVSKDSNSKCETGHPVFRIDNIMCDNIMTV